jgi:hypothetical protein
MDMQTIRNTFYGLLITGLLAGMAQDALAQRPVSRGERRGDDNRRPARTAVKKDKILKPSGRQAVRKDRTQGSVRPAERILKQTGRQDVRQKHIPRSIRRQDKILKSSPRQTVRNDRTAESIRSKARYPKTDNRRNHYRDSGKNQKTYARDGRHAYKHRDSRRYLPAKKSWQHSHHRKPAWVDYHRPGFLYPRIGLRVSVLPHGYFSFKLGNLRFYAYRGVYYRYNPALRVYVVVNKPRIETWYTSASWDRITLLDGSTIEGVYLYTDDDIVFFEVGDALLEIPMNEIRVLTLSEY